MRLLGEPDTNAKSLKSGNVANYILYLWPNKIICPESDGCMTDCLKSAGMGRFKSVRLGRYRKTKIWHKSPEDFMTLLRKDLQLVVRRMRWGTGSRWDGMQAYVRLNGTADIPWEAIDAWMPSLEFTHIENIMSLYPEIRFYDYTKDSTREIQPSENYKLTFSRGSSTKDEEILSWLRRGGSVACIFEGPDLPETYLGHPVIDGDKHDIRWKDNPGSIVGLRPKGQAKKSTNGFVIRDHTTTTLTV